MGLYNSDTDTTWILLTKHSQVSRYLAPDQMSLAHLSLIPFFCSEYQIKKPWLCWKICSACRTIVKSGQDRTENCLMNPLGSCAMWQTANLWIFTNHDRLHQKFYRNIYRFHRLADFCLNRAHCNYDMFLELDTSTTPVCQYLSSSLKIPNQCSLNEPCCFWLEKCKSTSGSY